MTKVVNVKMRLELIVDVVGMIVGIVVDNLAELNSRICCCWFGPSRILGDGIFTGEMLPKFWQNISGFT